MKNVLVPVITNFEATELITTLNVFKRNDVDYFIWSVEGLDLIQSNREALIMASSIYPQGEDFDAIFIPGGPGVKEMVELEEIIELISSFNKEGKIVSAICAAPMILDKAGILEGKRFTAHEASGLLNRTKEAFEVDGNIITGRDYSVTQEFAEALTNEIKK